MQYLPFYIFVFAILFGGLALTASVILWSMPRFRRTAVRALRWGGAPALILPCLVVVYVRVHLACCGRIDDDLGLLFYLIVTPLIGFGLGAIALAIREFRRETSRSVA